MHGDAGVHIMFFFFPADRPEKAKATSFGYMDTYNMNKGQNQIQSASCNFIQKEKGGLCPLLFQMAFMYTPFGPFLPGLGKFISAVCLCDVSEMCIRLCNGQLFLVSKNHFGRETKLVHIRNEIRLEKFV